MLLYGNKESREQVRIQLVMTSLAHIMILHVGEGVGGTDQALYTACYMRLHICAHMVCGYL